MRPRLLPLAAGFYLLLGSAGAIWIGLARGGPIPVTLFLRPAALGGDLLAGVAAGAGLLALWAAGRRWLPLARRLERRLAAALAGTSPEEALVLALLSALAEEVFFRGAVQGTFGLWPAALLFALLHSGPRRDLVLWGAFALVAGLVCGALVVLRGQLAPAIAAHFLVNAVGLRRLASVAPPPVASGDPPPPLC
ncbi:MAG TPA: CPBP family intramembrane metalloprotease [Thermoanaerobaculia bacterium]|mgnify:CR=1 FL=1|nr:CPBP family intramembrane metalloprotease [Thermoanaerobaculia bacterium]